jgi:hypothetical protein
VPESKSIPQVVSELREMTVAYAKQETVEPLKGLGRFIAVGVPSFVLLGIGLVLLTLAGLRALQTETGSTFTGNWSWAPYGIAMVLLLLLAGLAASRIARDRSGADR